MRCVSLGAMVGVALAVSACASDPIIVQPGRSSSSVYGGGYGGGYRQPQPDPLQSAARDTGSVERIASSIFRIGRMVSGGY
jgi:hypothetical protein